MNTQNDAWGSVDAATEVEKWRRLALETWATSLAEQHPGAEAETERLLAEVRRLNTRVKAVTRQNEELRQRISVLEGRLAARMRRAAGRAVRRFR